MALMFYLIYKITNNLNGKIYIGFHKTKNRDDGYMGSGKYLNYAYRKHGLENFTKEILFEFDNAADMYSKEAELVNEDFLAEENTYNLKIGGFGGWDYINSSGLGGKNGHVFTEEDRTKSREKQAERTTDQWREMALKSYIGTTIEQRRQRTEGLRKACLTDSAIEKKKNTWKLTGRGKGDRNSQAGTIWITNGIINKKVKKDTIIEDSWYRGRILKVKL